MSGSTAIGFSQRIRLEWLETTSQLLIAGQSRTEIQQGLQHLLAGELSVGSDARWGNRGKAISILLNVWVTARPELQSLRDEGLTHLRNLPVEDHLPIHWGMCMAAYPFFGTVAEITGRLVGLQGFAHMGQIQRRMMEQLGERETIERAVARTVRSFVDWSVLCDQDGKGLYGALPTLYLTDGAIVGWLVEASLLSKHVQTSALDSIIASPALFPFAISSLGANIVASGKRLDVFRQGLDQRMVALRSR